MTKKLELSEETLAALEDKDILTQCKTEFQMAKEMMTPKWQTWQTNLKLYNNQKRDKEAVGNNLLYTLFNTLLAFLYFDKLMVSFEPRESGDIERCELTTHLAKFDYEDMGMPKKKYDLLWDSLFFGNGFAYVGGLKDQTPQVEVLDPFTIYIDPFTTDISNARFIALEKTMTKWEMEKKKFNNIDSLGVPTNTQYMAADQARKDAKNEVSNEEKLEYQNKQFIILEWFTIRDGKKVHFFTDFNCSLLLTPVKPLVFKDKEFPIITQTFSPIPHEFWSLSVPDLLEDKQRASAVLVNLGLAMEKAKLYPRYLFDRSAILNIQDLKNPQSNKYIPTDPAGRSLRDIITPLEQSTITNSTNLIYEMIRDFAERTVGAPELRQGIVSRGKRTATELQLTSINSDTRNSLSAKLFTISDIEFWTKWLNRYKQFRTLAKDKIIRIQGALGVRFESIETDTFNFKTDPDIVIESTNVSLQKKMMDKQSLVELSKVIIDDETTIAAKRYYKRKLLQLSEFDKDEVDQVLPPTFDELRAQEENKLLEKGKLPEIEPYDDHYTHIIVHNTVPMNETTKAVVIAHLQVHKDAFLKEKQKEKELEYQQQTKPSQPGMAGAGAQPPTNINGAIEGMISKGRMPFERPQVPINQIQPTNIPPTATGSVPQNPLNQ